MEVQVYGKKAKIAAIAIAAMSGLSSITAGFITESFSVSAAAYIPTLNDDGYYEIANAVQLDWFGEQVNSGDAVDANAILVNDILYNENVLDENLALNEGDYTEWTRIGYFNSSSDYIAYSGTFDGNGYTISGLYSCITESNSTEVLNGLIGYMDGGTIKNLTISDSYFCDNTDRSYSNVGAICGEVRNSTFSNCIVSDSNVSVSDDVKSSSSSAYVGGLVGSVLICDFTFCASEGNYVYSSFTAGGIIGTLLRSSSNNASSNIDHCWNTSYVATSAYAGGIAGYDVGGNYKNNYTNCFNTGTIVYIKSDTVTMSNSVAGIIGRSSPTVNLTSCYTIGTVLSNTTSANGIVGSYTYTNLTDDGTTDCYYLSDTENEYEKTAEQFASGEVCYLLQSNNTDDVWGQEIGLDLYPVLMGNTPVYRIAWTADETFGDSDSTSSSEDDTALAYTYTNSEIIEQIALPDGYTYFYYDLISSGTKKRDVFFPWYASGSYENYTYTLYVSRVRDIELDDYLFDDFADEDGSTYKGVSLTGTVGVAFEADLTDYIADLDEVGELTFISSSLPEGLEMDATGIVSGTPTKAYANGLVTTVTIAFTDGATAEFNVVYTIAKKDISSGVTVDDDLANGTYYEGDTVPGASDMIQVTDENGNPISSAVEWTNVDPDGTLVAGDNELDYTFTPDDENLAPVSGTVVVNALPVVKVATNATTIEGVYGELISEDVSDYVTNPNEVGGVTYSSDNLPEGLEISSKGVISGTPTAVYPKGYEATVVATAGNGDVAEIPLEFVISLAAVAVDVADPDAVYYEGDTTPDANDVLAADIAGTFTWVKSNKTLALGDNELTWKFTPDDTDNYGVSTGTVTITAEAKVSVADYNVALVAEYGEEVSKDMSEYVFNADEVGGVTYTSTTLQTGLTFDAATGIIFGVPTALYVDGLDVTITVTAGNGSVDTIVVNAIIVKADPTDTITVDTEVTDGEVYYEGDAVPDVDDVLSSEIPGTFEWTTDKDTLDAGENELGWKFTPDDTAHYETVTGTVTIDAYAVVSVATETVTLNGEYDTAFRVELSEYVYNAEDVEGVTYSVDTLPRGLSLNSATGVISGVPTAVYADGFDSVVTVTAGNSSTAEIEVVITIAKVTANITISDITADDYTEGDVIPDIDDIFF